MATSKSGAATTSTSYVVRIYRCGPSEGKGHRTHDAIELIGTVEDAQSGSRHSFQSIEELWSLLAKRTRTSGCMP